MNKKKGMKVFEEFIKKDLEPLNSFKVHNELQKDIWDGFKMKKDIRKSLLNIAQEYYNGLDINAEIYDIILTGSISNYNYSKYSDFDLHILVDFEDINNDVKMVKQFVDMSRKIWNDTHDIKLVGFEVEVYIQEKNEAHTSSGIYSVLKDRWLVRPVMKDDVIIDIKEIENKGTDIMNRIDELEEMLEMLESDEKDINHLKENASKIWEKIKRFRKEGLEIGEMGVGNLIFKFLRRNGYIGKLIKIKNKLYDMELSNQ